MPRRNKRPPMWSNGKGATCAYCKRQLQATGSYSSTAATRDHVIPKSEGGTRRVWCCFACNNLKANKSPREWQAFMLANPEWWKTRAPKNNALRGATALRNFMSRSVCQ